MTDPRPSRGMRVMGIVNTTPDSFWSKSRFDDVSAAVAAGAAMFEMGAWAVDVGGESTRPGATPVPVESEIERVIPVISRLAPHGVVSVDTRHYDVAIAAVHAGAHIINDVSGHLHGLAGQLGVGYVGMHAHTVPVAASSPPPYDDVYAETTDFLLALKARADHGGAAPVWIDPGIGFGKSTDDNLAILQRLPDLCSHGIPVLLGVSRKSFIGAVTGRPVASRLAGSLAVIGPAWDAGVDVLRVHDVAETLDTLAMLTAIRRGRT